MATENLGKVISMLAGADLSAKQYCFVAGTATDNTVNTAGAGVAAIGVLQDNPASGRAGAVMINGVSKIVAGGTVAAGAKVASDASGHAVTAATGNYILGTAKTGGASGAVIEIIFEHHGISP